MESRTDVYFLAIFSRMKCFMQQLWELSYLRAHMFIELVAGRMTEDVRPKNKISFKFNSGYFFAIAIGTLSLFLGSARADLAPCPQDSPIVTASGKILDIKQLWGFHISTRLTDGVCRAETLEGLIWWRNEQLTSVAPKDMDGWTHFKIAFGFSQEAESIYSQEGGRILERPRGTLRTPEWKGQEIALDNYPGLTIRLSEGLEMNEPSNFKGYFTIDAWRREGGYRRIVICSTVATNHRKSTVPMLSGEDLKVHSFENDYDICELDIPDFSMSSGSGRVSFSGGELRDAATALPQIYEYIQAATMKKGI